MKKKKLYLPWFLEHLFVWSQEVVHESVSAHIFGHVIVWERVNTSMGKRIITHQI
jgi:hypothetical protein